MAKIAPHAYSAEDEEEAVQTLREAGVIVAGGHRYHTDQHGWARLTFAVPEERLREALRRIEKVYNTSGV